MWPFSKFLFIDILKFYFVDLPCLYRFFAVHFLLAYLYAKLFTVFCLWFMNMHIFNEYIWKPVYSTGSCNTSTSKNLET